MILLVMIPWPTTKSVVYSSRNHERNSPEEVMDSAQAMYELGIASGMLISALINLWLQAAPGMALVEKELNQLNHIMYGIQ